MARFKDFGSGEALDKEPINFTLYNENFECYPAIPGKVLLDFAKTSSKDDNSSTIEALDSFFSKSMKPESYERFAALIVDPERVVSMKDLVSVVEWLIAEYAERPTEGSEPS